MENQFSKTVKGIGVSNLTQNSPVGRLDLHVEGTGLFFRRKPSVTFGSSPGCSKEYGRKKCIQDQ